MLFVARIDALWTVAAVEVLVEFKTAELFQNWHAILFRATWVNGGFVNYNISRFKKLTNSFAGSDKGSRVWALVLVNGGRYGDDKAVARMHVIRIRTKFEVFSRLKFFGLCLKFEIVANFKLFYSLWVDVKTYHRACFAKLNG